MELVVPVSFWLDNAYQLLDGRCICGLRARMTNKTMDCYLRLMLLHFIDNWDHSF